MALRLLVGPEIATASGRTSLNSGQLRVYRNNCHFDGIVTEFDLYANVSGNAKIGLTDDGGMGVPTNLLVAENTGVAVTGGQWNTGITVTPQQVFAANLYGMAAVADTNGVLTYNADDSDANTGRYNAVTNSYSSGVPSTMPALTQIGGTCYQYRAWGYINPSITSVDGDNDITADQTGVSLVGTDLVDSAGNPTLELCNNSDYQSATVKVSQTVNSTSDTGINFDVVQGALSTGTVYAFVTTALGQLNTIAFAVTLSAAAGGATDTPQTGTFSYSGLTLSAVSAVSDAPQAGTFSYAGLTLSAFQSKIDAPQAGVFSYSGLTLDAFVTSPGADTPLPGEFSYSGLDLNAFSNVTDSPQPGTFSYSGLTLDAFETTGKTDTLETGVFSYSGLTLEAASQSIDLPLPGLFEYSGLNVNTSMGVSDSPQAGIFSYSGLSLNAISSNLDAPQAGTFEYTGLLLNAFAVEVREDEVEWNSIRRVILRQIPFGSNSVALAFNMPPSWDVSQVSSVTVQIADKLGVEVLATDDCTLYSGATLNGDVFQFDDKIILNTSAEAPLPGEMLTIVGSAAIESVVVKAYDSTTKTVTLESLLQNDFEDGASIYGNTVEYSADVSDTTVFTAGKTFVATWTPSGSGAPIKTFLQITKFEADTSNLEVRFSALYPRAYEAFKKPVDKFQRMVTEAQSRIEVEMLSAHMDYHRIVGESILPQLLMAKMAMMWVFNADEDLEDERKVINTDYTNLFAVLKSLPIWTDTNQDGIKNETIGEFTSHNHIFGRSW